VLSPHGVVMPPLRSMLASIGSQVVEGTLVPALIFWSMLHLTGLVWALLSGLAWCYLAIARRWARGTTLPAVLVVGALLFTTRTGVALAFHSTFVYLLTPTINAFVLAAAFAGSALLRRPLARSLMTPVLSAVAVLCCVLMGRRALRAEGIHLHLRWRDQPA
jgi:intracellular septation protein A